MKCGECPLSLPCYAGKLQPIAWCLRCYYLTVREGADPPTNLRDVLEQQVRLRCEPRTEEMLRYTGIFEGVVRDPIVAKNQMAVTRCAKCDAKERLSKGMASALAPADFAKCELD